MEVTLTFKIKISGQAEYYQLLAYNCTETSGKRRMGKFLIFKLKPQTSKLENALKQLKYLNSKTFSEFLHFLHLTTDVINNISLQAVYFKII